MRRVARRRIPASLARRGKKGLGVPQAEWLRTVLRQRMEACLEQSRQDGWFRHPAISALWQDHLARRADHRRALWTFLFSFPFQRGGSS
jgi:asparagine synthase (glutamine-hydrolysing)